MRYYEDRLVIRERADSGKLTFRGKRIPKDCSLPRVVIRAYVKGGIVQAVKTYLACYPNMGLRSALDAINAARFPKGITSYSQYRRR